MGFGWLIVGYFFVNVMSLYSPLSFAMLAGYPMMMWGLWQLAPYQKRFFECFWCSLLSVPFALYFSLFAFGEMGLGVPTALFADGVFAVMEWLYFLFNIVFHLFLLTGVGALAAELGLESHRQAAWRNILVVGAFALLYTAAGALEAMSWSAYLVPLVILLKLFYIFLNVYLFYQCYRYICPEESAIREAEEEARSRRRVEDAQNTLKGGKKREQK